MARILLIDDNEQFRSVVDRMLSSAGYEVVQATQGREAMTLYRSQPFDLIIVDLIMPEKDGLEVIKELREEPTPPKIIAVSGGGRIEATRYLELARRMGAVQVLGKPFTRDELLTVVKSHMESPNPPEP